MRGKLFLFGLLLTSVAGFSQVGIGTTLPNSSSQLEVTATDKGMLIPRVALTGTSDATTITNGNVTSLLVYNTATVAGASGVVPGFYYWNGTKWSQILNKDNTTGFDVTDDAFVNNATTNAVELGSKSDGVTVRDANTEFVILDTGNVGVGTATPSTSSVLDLSATDKGILIPRIALTGTSDAATIANGNVTSLMAYNTATVSDVSPGFYFWDGTKWNRIINQDDIDALPEADLRMVGANNHITQDAGVGSDGTSAGTGVSNILMGRDAGSGLTTGSYNLLMGQGAGVGLTTNRENIALGYNASRNAGTTLYRSILIGSAAGLNANSSELIAIGSNSGQNNTGWGNVFMGPRSGFSNTTGNLNTMIGYEAGQNATTAVYSTFLGFRAGKGIGAINTGNSNTYLGYQAGFANSTGASNSAVGMRSSEAMTNGSHNSSLGTMAMAYVQGGSNNVAIGSHTGTGKYGSDPHDNVMIGYRTAQRIETGRYNTLLGGVSASSITTGTGNSFVGYQTGRLVTTGINNTLLGNNGGYDLTTGNDNIAIGYQTRGFATGNQNIVIGYRSQIDNAANNQLNIGNLIYGTGVNTGTGTTVSNGSIGIGTSAPKTNAILDMSDVDNKGVLLPKVALTSTTDDTTIDIRNVGTAISKNMLVYNTATVADVTEGYYYWNGSRTDGKWEKLINASDLDKSGMFKINTTYGTITNTFDNGSNIYGTRNFSFVVGSDRMDNNTAFADDDNRLFFNKQKGAFRAGTTNSATWDNANVGSNSVAFGNGTTASGLAAYASGFGSQSSGMVSFAHGLGARSEGLASVAFGGGIATGDHSFALGSTANASNTNAVALGINTQAVGANSFALGSSATAESFGQFSLGLYPTVTTGEIANYITTDRLFVVGNGTDAGNRSDALTILKSGNTTLNGSLTLNTNNGGFLMPKVALTGTTDATTITTGNVEGLMVYNTATTADVTPGFYSWNGTAWTTLTPASTPAVFATTANVTSNSPGNITTDDFVFGSTQLDNTGNPNQDSRMFFDKSKSAFRAGYSNDNTYWNATEIGDYSFAGGYATEASGEGATAFGYFSHATGDVSTAIGPGAFARGYGTVALGDANANGDNSIALGQNALSDGLRSVAIGYNNRALNSYGTALGFASWSSANNAIALGTFSRSDSYGQISLGLNNTELAGNNTAYVATDRLFVIGNGTDSANRSDALTMLKNGNTTLNGSLTVNTANGGFLMPKVALTGTTDATTIATGNVEGLMVYNTATVADVTPGFYSWNGTAWAAVGGSTGVFTTTANVTSNASGNIATDDFLFGSTQLADLAGNDDNARMFFDKSKAAFRAGSALSDQFNDANVGNFSTGIGYNALASGISSVSIGNGNRAFGGNSVGIGTNNVVNGTYSVLLGSQNTSNTDWFTSSLGNNNNLSGQGSTAVGYGNTTSARYATALGSFLTTETYGQVSLGYYNTNVTGDATNAVATDRLLVVGNGTSAVKSDALTLLKNGNMTIAGSLTTAGATYPDYVFEKYVDGSSNIDKTYTFKSLKEVEAFIKANKHLPGVTGINDLKKTKNGYQINLTKLSTQTLEKVEELYLHTIEQQKKIDTLKAENDALKARLSKIETVLGIK